MKNKILSAIISIVLMISLVGCQQNNKIIRPDVETKTVTENSQEDYVTFSLDVPSDWKVLTQDYVSIACFKLSLTSLFIPSPKNSLGTPILSPFISPVNAFS